MSLQLSTVCGPNKPSLGGVNIRDRTSEYIGNERVDECTVSGLYFDET